MTRTLHNGWFGAAVSIRAGGVERILRLTRLFRDPLTAAEGARSEALRWIAAPPAAAAA